MSKFFIYLFSFILSTALFVLILCFSGVLGPAAAGYALVVSKVLGWAALYALMIRIPFAIISARDKKKTLEIRKEYNDEAMQTINKAVTNARKDVVNMKGPSIDNPIAPMPIDPDLE